MNSREYLEILHVAERLKDTTRHCTTSNRRTESVAEHSWRISLMAFLLRHEFPDVDINKVVDMCLIHDLGECFTGDIPTFIKTLAENFYGLDIYEADASAIINEALAQIEKIS
ncbi:HD domain-containing protein [Lachnospiraceae bacterium XBD2001]|jgi:putative hydrolase of HD superfamily|nr:HD domain-containing protein [Lachnospiraceae bacterium XBD2001]